MSSRVPSTGNGQPSWGVPLTEEGQPPSGVFFMSRESSAPASGPKRILVIVPGVNSFREESDIFSLHRLALETMVMALRQDCHGCSHACGPSDIEEIGATSSCSHRRATEVSADQEQAHQAIRPNGERDDTDEQFEDGRLGHSRARLPRLGASDLWVQRSDSSTGSDSTTAALARAAGVLPNASKIPHFAEATPGPRPASSGAALLAASQASSPASLAATSLDASQVPPSASPFAGFLDRSHVSSFAAPTAALLAASEVPPSAASLAARQVQSSSFIKVAGLVIEDDRARVRARSHSQEAVDGGDLDVEDLDDSDDDAASTEVRP